MAALDCVDFVAIDRERSAASAIRLLRPDYYVKGQEFESLPRPPARLQTEIEAVQEVGGQMCFTHEEVFSSTALLTALESGGRPPDLRAVEARARPAPGASAAVDAGALAGAVPDAARRFVDAFRTRHRVDDVLAGLAALRDLRVLVIGEAIVDEYRYCVPLGKSPKEAIVTTREVRQERHAGGALACANHVAGFCREVDLVAASAPSRPRSGSSGPGSGPNVTPRFVIRPDAPTITKRRYLWEPDLVKLFEVAVMEDTPLPAPLEDELLRHLDGALPGYDVVIVADYGHGFLGARRRPPSPGARGSWR